MRVLISGGTGLIGSALTTHLPAQGHDVYRLVRTPPLIAKDIFWDPVNQSVDRQSCEGFDVFINLSGHPIASKRWSEREKELIRSSRINSTSFLLSIISTLSRPPKGVLNASAVGYYGERGEQLLDETSPRGQGFLAETCEEWESVVVSWSQKSAVRTCLLRLGVVLSPEGCFLRKVLPPFRLGLGGPFGDGDQYVSWIAMMDLMRGIDFLIDSDQMSGPVNMVSPEPLRNRELCQILGKILNRPAMLRIPAVFLRLGLGEMADQVLLCSQRVMPARLIEAGFQFKFATIGNAFRYY